MSKRVVLPFVLVLCCCLPTFRVVGHNVDYEIVAVYGSTPAISGNMHLGEWDDAESVSFNYTEVFVKQDGRNLYVAFNVSDATIDARENVHIYFDVNHDDGASFKPDDILMAAFRNGTLVEGHLENGTYVNATGWSADTFVLGGFWQAEFNITYAKINVTAGVEKTLGVAFEVIDFDFAYIFQSWPHNLRDYGPPLDPSMWGGLISSPYNWIPEFSPLSILPLLIIAPVLFITVRFILKKNSFLRMCA